MEKNVDFNKMSVIPDYTSKEGCGIAEVNGKNCYDCDCADNDGDCDA